MPTPGRHREGAQVIGHARVDAARRNRPGCGSRSGPARSHCWRSMWKPAAARVVRDSSVVDHDVVAVGVGREEAVDAVGRQRLVARRCGRAWLVAVVEQLAGLARRRSGRRRSPGYLPFSSQVMKNGDQSMYGTISREREIVRATACPRNDGRGDVAVGPVDARTAGGGPRRRGRACAAARGANDCALLLLHGAVLRGRARPRTRAGSAGRRRRRSARRPSRGHRPVILRRDLDGRVLGAGRRAADQERHRRSPRAPSRGRRAPSRRATA